MDDFEKLYNSSLKFLSFRPRSEKEVRENLKKKFSKKIEPSELSLTIERVVGKLKKQNFINDLEFAKLWIEQRMRFKPRSLKLIKIELKYKGISDEIIESQISPGDGKISNLEMAKKLVEKRIKRLDLLELKDRQKLQRFLASKGFDWSTIEEVLKDSRS